MAVCRWLASQVRRLMKRVELLEHPRLAMRAEMLAELARQRTEGERLAAEAAQCAAAGKAAVKQAEERVLALNTPRCPRKVKSLPWRGGHNVERVSVVPSDVVKDTRSTMMKPAKEIYESRNIGSRPTTEWPSW